MSMTRTLWTVSRCAKARLQSSIPPTRYSLPCRSIHDVATPLAGLQEQPKKKREPKPKILQPAKTEGETPKKRGRPRKVLQVKNETEGETQDILDSGKSEVKKPRKRKSLPDLPESGNTAEPPENAFYPSSQIPKLHLPPSAEWKKEFETFTQLRIRPTVRNPSTARMLAEAFVPEGSMDKIIIEAFPGPGQLSRALLSLPRERIKKLIVVEPVPEFYGYLEPLTQIDDRVILIKSNPRDWVTYTDMEKSGLMNDVTTTSWDSVHPQLQFIMQTAGGVDGERVATQLLRTIPDRQWLFKYGRMPMSLVLSDRLYERFTTSASVLRSSNRCKASVIAETVSNISQVVPYDKLQPYRSHFFPEHGQLEKSKINALDALRPGNPRVAIEIIPLQHQEIKAGDLDIWDYVLRKLFVAKSRTIEDGIVALGPGARNLFKKLVVPRDGHEIFDLQKRPRELNTEEWSWLVEVFKNWPFRPTNLGVEQLIKMIP